MLTFIEMLTSLITVAGVIVLCPIVKELCTFVKKKPETKRKGKLKKGKEGLKEGSKTDLKIRSAQVKH